MGVLGLEGEIDKNISIWVVFVFCDIFEREEGLLLNLFFRRRNFNFLRLLLENGSFCFIFFVVCFYFRVLGFVYNLRVW